MKRIYNKIFIVGLAIFFSSCSIDWLDVKPSDGATLEETIKDVKSAKVMLAGVYDALQGNSDFQYYYGAGMIYYGDVRGDDMQSVAVGSRTAWAYLMDYNANAARHIWREPYRLIRRANILIEAIDNGAVVTTSDAEEAIVKDIKAQALAIRALAHFDLLRVYARAYDVNTYGDNYGVPVMLSVESQKPSAQPGRETIAKTFELVEKDLNAALELPILSDQNTGYFNSWAVKLLLARIYLYKGTDADLAKAYKLCAEDIIPNSPYQLWKNEDYLDAWSGVEGSSEMILEVISAGSDDMVDRESISYLLAEDGYNDIVLTKSFIEFLDSNYADDVRSKLRTNAVKSDNITNYGTNKVYLTKYPGRSGDLKVTNVPVLRLSEAYLIAAEAAMRTNDKPNAVKYLNPIIERGNPAATKVSEATVSLDRVLDERRVEFVGEGHRFFDLMRNNKTVVRYTSEANRGWHVPLTETVSRSFTRDYFRVILPIPDVEILVNPVIADQQNAEY